MPSALAQADDAAALAGVVRDPVRFCCGLLRQDLWPLQEAILRAVASRSRVAVKACHASGKTFVAAVAVLWLVTRYRDGIVVTTAPTWTQVEKLLRGEIHQTWRASRAPFPMNTARSFTLPCRWRVPAIAGSFERRAGRVSGLPSRPAATSAIYQAPHRRARVTRIPR